MCHCHLQTLHSCSVHIFSPMSWLRLVLIPLSWPYALALRIRHALYDHGILRPVRARVATIAVGNIALGGTGKTPHAELVLSILLAGQTQDQRAPLATLSRGYGRRGTDLMEVKPTDPVALVGDEPLMLKRKFNGVRVFVGADRVAGVAAITARVPEVMAIVLDDALQHRALKADLNIVLTTWQRPWHKDHLLPAGDLRDIPYRARQADAVIVTKCPRMPSAGEQYRWRRQLGLREGQALFFSALEYAPPQYVACGEGIVPTGPEAAALLFTGIAHAEPLVEHARSLFGTVRHAGFGDHHRFRLPELERLAALFHSFAHGPKTLITTEKDAARLGDTSHSGPLAGLPLAVIGVKAAILTEPHAFEALIRSHVATHPANR